METENTSSNNKVLINYALRWGAIMGMTILIIQLMVYLLSKSSLVSFTYGIVNFVLQVIILVVAVYMYRKNITNGLLSFKEGFTIVMLIFAGSALINSVFQFLLYNVIDPELSTYIYERTLEMTTNMMEKFGAPEEEIEKAIEKINPEDLKLTAQRLVTNYFFSLLFGVFFAVIIAAIFRKKPQIDQIS
jgi:hypothetical protein